MSVHLVIPDPHAHYQHNNNRAIWLGKLINELHPDVVINLGDSADMPSLSGYDKGKKTFAGRTYAADIAAHSDFQDKLWSTVRKSKRKMPRRVTLIGNHEQRIERAINLSPELDGAISYKDLELEHFYQDVVHYNGQTPGVIQINSIFYSHYFTSGIMGNAVSGEHPAYSLLSKKHASCTQGHSHIRDHCTRTTEAGKRIEGLVAGCYFDYDSDWAGECNKLYWRGVVIKRGVESGNYDPEFVSLARLRKEYGPS